MEDRDQFRLEKEKEQEEILRVVRDFKKAESQENQLVFNEETGEFEVVKTEDLSDDPDIIPISEVAEDGWA